MPDQPGTVYSVFTDPEATSTRISVTAKMEKEFCDITPEATTVRKTPGVVQTLLRSLVVQNRSLHAIGVQPADGDPTAARYVEHPGALGQTADLLRGGVQQPQVALDADRPQARLLRGAVRHVRAD